MNVSYNVYVYILLKGLLSLPIVSIPNKSCHRAPFSLSYSFDRCLLSWDFISAWCLCLCMKVCVKYQPAQCSYWEARQLHNRSLLSFCKYYVVAYEMKYKKTKKFWNEISATVLAEDKKFLYNTLPVGTGRKSTLYSNWWSWWHI